MKSGAINNPIPRIAQELSHHLQGQSFDFKDASKTSILDFLYIAYSEIPRKDSKEIEQGFLDLDNYMEHISLDDNNAIFSLICRLCSSYEQRAFIEGVQLGAYLMLELQK